MSENVKRYYVYNGELLGPDLFDPAEDDEGLYVAVVTRDAFLRERERAEIAEDRARLAEAGNALADSLAMILPALDQFNHRNDYEALKEWRAALSEWGDA